MIKGKKALFFTLLAVLLMSILVVLAKSQSYVSLINKVPVVETRINNANDFMHDLKFSILERCMYVATKNSLDVYFEYLEDKDGFDSNADFQKAMGGLVMSGEIPVSSGIPAYTHPNSMSSLITKLEKIANESLRYNLEIGYSDFNIYQSAETGPWLIGVDMEFHVKMNAHASSWDTTFKVTSYQSIIGLKDMYHILNTLPGNDRMIASTTDTVVNKYVVQSRIDLGKYNYREHAPSYLNRLIGSSQASACCGIESFIPESNLYKIDSGSYREASFIDYCYFSNGAATNCAGELFTTTDITTPEYPFKIDVYHMGVFDIVEDSQLYVSP